MSQRARPAKSYPAEGYLTEFVHVNLRTLPVKSHPDIWGLTVQLVRGTHRWEENDEVHVKKCTFTLTVDG